MYTYTGWKGQEHLDIFEWIDTSILHLHQTYHNIFYGYSEGSPRYVKVVNWVNFNVLISTAILLQINGKGYSSEK